ncbi:unannotated protein [freshwater metagenome]|uniref:Unannotated protein n=1 Tax=freshwater metagenome TaxID=449393 RepID=A0A6J7IQY9_9ZZZZ
MPYSWVTGSSSRSMPRTSIEYGGCSLMNRPECRTDAAHCACTTCEGRNVEDPK